MSERKYQRPEFLLELHSQDNYEKWLGRKTSSLVKRDRKWLLAKGQSDKGVTGKIYKKAIHKAVKKSDGKDAYTGEQLDWTLLGKYNNEESKKGGRAYKKGFALLPTIDHVEELGVANFEICSWQTNDAKNDLSLDEFKVLCKKVLEHN